MQPCRVPALSHVRHTCSHTHTPRLNESRAQRLVWLLEELGLDYDVEIFQRDEDMRAPAALTKVHPLGKAPILSVSFPDTQKEMVLAESGFIVQYLTEQFGQATSLLPKRYRDGQEGEAGGETDEWMRYQYFLHYAEGSLMPPILVALVLQSTSDLIFLFSCHYQMLTEAWKHLISPAKPQGTLLSAPHHIVRRRPDVCRLPGPRNVNTLCFSGVTARDVSRQRAISVR